ncbi:MAG: DUF433 domain-containing protein [Vicingaceae bacterium]
MKNYSKYIVIDAGKRFGKPVLKGTRISVYDVLSWLAQGKSREEIMEDFPELTISMINACLAYAADKEHKHRLAS